MLLDVIVPAPWWNALTYNFINFNNFNDLKGLRVRVPLGSSNGGRVGFVSELTADTHSENLKNKNIEIKEIIEIIDEKPVLKSGLWELALWLGRTFLCGTGIALKTICPNEILTGEKLDLNNLNLENKIKINSEFHEKTFFDPRDAERLNFYLEMLRRPVNNLILFPEINQAKKFFKNLPDDVKDVSILWPSTGGKKLWDAWKSVYSGNVKNVIAPPGGVFAPLNAESIIVEEEASEGYLSRRQPVVSARSVAGKRAIDLKAEIILCGRVPSSKTFLRNNIKCEILPDKKNLIFVDIKRSLKVQEDGIDGELAVTIALLERTRKELQNGNNVLWLLDRKGGAAEVICSNCGHEIKCVKCGGIMRSEQDGKFLKCSKCGNKENMPEKCPDCGGVILSGRRPGLEVLKSSAEKLIKNYNIVMLDDTKKFKSSDLNLKKPSLILGTRGALALCDDYNITLAAWLDLDSEMRRQDYNAKFRVFNMVWQSCWRGNKNGERKILIQSRRHERDYQLFTFGWEKFWRDELALRQDLDLPPFGILIKIEFKNNNFNPDELISRLEDAGLSVMNFDDEFSDDGGAKSIMRLNKILISTKSMKPVIDVLQPYFDIANSKNKFKSEYFKITVYAE